MTFPRLKHEGREVRLIERTSDGGALVESLDGTEQWFTGADDLIVVAPKAFETLTVNDRCDRCGAQAWTAWGSGARAVLFCIHHTRDHEPALIEQGFELLVDQRDQINTKGGAST